MRVIKLNAVLLLLQYQFVQIKTQNIVPRTCEEVLDVLATDGDGTYSCGSRIDYLIGTAGLTSDSAKNQVANEFPVECGACAVDSTGGYTFTTEGRSLLWSDEFNQDGAPDPSNWGYDIGDNGWGNNELQRYTSDERNAYVEGGKLKIRAVDNGEITSARLVSRNKYDFKYGYAEVRASLPNFEGAWPALWMLPTDWEYGGWPDSGEIDIMEHVSCDPGVYHATVHTRAYYHSIGTQRGGSRRMDTNPGVFHVYQMDWTADRIIFGVDGIPVFTFENDGKGDYKTWPFNKRFHFLFNIAVGGAWGGYCLGGKRPSFSDDGITNVMQVDYVRVYSERGDQINPTPPPTPLLSNGETCESVWNLEATDKSGTYTCGARISWLQTADGGSYSDAEAKNKVAEEFPSVCGPCKVKISTPEPTFKPSTPEPTFKPSTPEPTFKPSTPEPTPKPSMQGETCESVWNLDATDSSGTYTCGGRITWLQSADGGNYNEIDAKNKVAEEFPSICGACKENTCESVWDSAATDGSGTYTCGQRISWLQTASGGGLSEAAAREKVAGEFPSICGACRDYHSQNESRILFIGNSFTYYNNMPSIVQAFANERSLNAKVSSVTKGGASWYSWVSNSEDWKRIEDVIQPQDFYDTVVLQERSQKLSYTSEEYSVDSIPYGLNIYRKVRTQTQNVVLYNTWGWMNGNRGGDYYDMQNRLEQGYTAARVAFEGEQDASQNHADITISWVGRAWKKAYAIYGSRLYTGDGFHPSPLGSYLAALVHFTHIFKESPQGLSYSIVNPEETNTLQDIVHDLFM